ncbi:uncharacterized protein I303_101630 [Kwoniella dejecticola CBS 10117]|uniref:Bromodomain associated domain-containing protein n=1 Tax=Kwoniella dejecticola CBS 10117 TaxID=1296121 RepID=A0AAJ8KJX0_9TREE
MSTINSLPSTSSSKYIPPEIPPVYLRQIIVDLLLRRGFEGAEAGALTEIERLLEHHITNLFEDSLEYAHLTGRQEANVADLVAAQEESGWGYKRLKRESKRKRGQAPQIEYEQSSAPPSPSLPTLSSLLDIDPNVAETDDRKPDLYSHGTSSTNHKGKGTKPIYSQEWFPSLPEKWTLLGSSTSENNELPLKEDIGHDHARPPNQVTTALLDFIKLTATERGDIPPELGVVNYGRIQNLGGSTDGDANGRGVAGSKGIKRKWGVKGVSTKS